ncbi:MAG: AAA domain-containing protein [Gallionella sp.]|nr:AAA domain-containing protein [Gallionella sp.]
MSTEPVLPSQKQINYAKKIAADRKEDLPQNVLTNLKACRAYLNKYAKNSVAPIATKQILTESDGPKLPTELQRNFVTDIYNKLSDAIDLKELELGLSSYDNCRKFIDKHRNTFDARIQLESKKREQKSLASFRKELNFVDFITPELRAAVAAEKTSEDKENVIRAYRKAGKSGYSRLDASKLRSTTEKLLGYWLEGLQSTAFDAMGSLPNLIGDPKSVFGVSEIETLLNEHACDGIKFDQPHLPVRHLVLKLVKEKAEEKSPPVLSVLPLMAIRDPQAEKGYRWTPAIERIPLFNRNLIGESAKFPGLMCDNVDKFDAWAVEQEAIVQPDGVDSEIKLGIRDALDIWDEAFNVLAEPGLGGIQGWIARFIATRSEFWQIKKRKAVFALVDGGAVSGASRQVCNAYRQLIAEPEMLNIKELSLFRRAADTQPLPQKNYDTAQQGLDLTHITRYLGHMDSFKDGKREAFPLDPAQRDALIALDMTSNGELLAVNGPPGTGKTSLLRGVIASQWVAPLLTDAKQPMCPLILACAATNQAVTNIISSFDETPGAPLFGNDGSFLSGSPVSADSRWLPRLASYGWYAPPQVTQDVLRDYGKYQLIDREGTHKPWEFKGIVEGFGNFNETQSEDAYLYCAELFFGVRLDLPSTLQRLRQRVIQDKQNITKLQGHLGDWIKELHKLMSTDPWTVDHEERRQQLVLHAEPLAGKSGRQTQLHEAIAVFDAKIDQLARFNDFGTPVQQYVGLLATLPTNDPLKTETDYTHIKQQYDDLASLAAKLEETLHLSFLHRIKVAFSTVFQREETELRWSAMGEAMRACNLDVADGQPDIDAWLSAITARRGVLRARLDLSAAEGLRIYLAKKGIELTPTDDYRTLWPVELDAYRETLRAKRSQLVLEMKGIDERLAAIKSELSSLDHVFQARDAARARVKDARVDIVADLATFGDGVSSDMALLKSMDEAFTLTLAGTQSKDGLAQHQFDINKHAQDWLDTNVRVRIFHLAARYWEGRYVQSRKDTATRLYADENYVMRSEDQLRELAMLAPVFVVTAYSAPKLMRRNLQDFEENVPPYLFGEAELLIVDEAGQGTAEIGANAFMFARKSIVVGDVAQLEPVWNMGESADKGLVRRFDLAQIPCVEGQTPYQALVPSGILLACGSVMRMAQRATMWTNPAFPDTPGLTLTNHYRCLTSIIEICNRMVYRSTLHVATRAPNKLWRPELSRLGFLVTDEMANTKNPGGSRRNQSEAECIARWIYENEASIVKHYSTKKVARIEDVLAIVTPFSGQKLTLKRALAAQYKLKWDEQDKDAIYNKMVINTVHTLQGAEKQIVIFAMVETNDPSGSQFYDRGANLINVAISRAKEMFIVAMTQKAVDYARNLTPKTLSKPSDYLWQAVVANGSRLNARRLIIVESPNKCETIKKALGSSIEVEVIATEGHIAKLEEPQNWNALLANSPSWSALSDTGSRVFARIETLWPDLEACYLATDPDAEGEAIAWHILRVLRDRQGAGDISAPSGKMPLIKRMRFYNLEPTEVNRAYDVASTGLDAGMIKSALARGLIDYLITTEYPQRIRLGSANSFARGIGRVQLGVLDLVSQAIRNKPSYGVKVSIPLDDGSKFPTYVLRPSANDADDINRIWQTDNVEVAEKAALRMQARLNEVGLKVAIQWTSDPLRQHEPYPGLNTARLLALAWRAKRMQPVRVMAALQALYEGATELARPNAGLQVDAQKCSSTEQSLFIEE